MVETDPPLGIFEVRRMPPAVERRRRAVLEPTAMNESDTTGLDSIDMRDVCALTDLLLTYEQAPGLFVVAGESSATYTGDVAPRATRHPLTTQCTVLARSPGHGLPDFGLIQSTPRGVTHNWGSTETFVWEAVIQLLRPANRPLLQQDRRRVEAVRPGKSTGRAPHSYSRTVDGLKHVPEGTAVC